MVLATRFFICFTGPPVFVCLHLAFIFKSYKCVYMCLHLCYLCFVFVMLSRLFIAALWSPAGKGPTSWLSFVMFNCVFVTFPCGILGQVWCLIVIFVAFLTFKILVLTISWVKISII